MQTSTEASGRAFRQRIRHMLAPFAGTNQPDDLTGNASLQIRIVSKLPAKLSAGIASFTNEYRVPLCAGVALTIIIVIHQLHIALWAVWNQAVRQA